MNLINLIKSKNQINTTNWKYFEINRIFNIYSSKNNLDKNKIIKNGEEIYNYVTRTENNNGIYGKISKQKVEINEGNCLTIGLDTQSVNYQDEQFYTGQNVHILRILNIHKKNVYIFICSLLRKILKTKYFWGSNGATIGRLKSDKIKLPVDANGEPNWEYMDNYIAQKEKQIMENIPKLIEQIKSKNEIDTTNWKYFKISELFNFPKVKKYSKIDKSIGETPFITSQSSNNGIAYLCGLNSEIQNAITISTNGNNFDCFYHDYKFIPSSDVELITHDKLNKNIALFISTILDKESKKYTYGKKAKNGAVGRTIIKLPVDANGWPDWEYMENYVKNKWNYILNKLN